MTVILPGITPDYVIRMNAELEQLNARIVAASAFTQTNAFEELTEDDQHLLASQIFAMQTYSAILDLRMVRAQKRNVN